MFGTHHRELLNWLSGRWLEEPQAVCVIEGFPGVGKSFVIDYFAIESSQPVHRVELPDEDALDLDDVLLTILGQLDEQGVRSESDDPDLLVHLGQILRQRVAIVIDEFQHSFEAGTGRPHKRLCEFIRRLGHQPRLDGRLVLVTSRHLEASVWSERCIVKRLDALDGDSAVDFLTKLLTERGLADEVPELRRAEVVRWLGHNPRAIQTLVSGLTEEPLDDLIGVEPEVWELRDQVVSPELLHGLERPS